MSRGEGALLARKEQNPFRHLLRKPHPTQRVRRFALFQELNVAVYLLDMRDLLLCDCCWS